MYGDTSVIRRLADALRGRADEVRELAQTMATRAERAAWSGLAADAMRRRIAAQGAALRRAADLHDDAARALDHHADEVDRLKHLIASIERRVHDLVSAARDRLAGLAAGVVHGVSGALDLLGGLGHLVPDPVDELLDRFVPPAPGSRAWLAVDLPGLAA